MNHINEDTLLKYVLEIIDDEHEYSDIKYHLTTCAECRTRLEKIQSDLDIIGDIKPAGSDIDLPVRQKRQNIFYPILRAAALIIFGIVIGYGAANLRKPDNVSVTPSYAILSPAPDSLVGVAVSDATEIKPE
jgi:hypothetical protein